MRFFKRKKQRPGVRIYCAKEYPVGRESDVRIEVGGQDITSAVTALSLDMGLEDVNLVTLDLLPGQIEADVEAMVALHNAQEKVAA